MQQFSPMLLWTFVILLLPSKTTNAIENIRLTGFEPEDRYYISPTLPGNVRLSCVETMNCPEGKYCLKVVMGGRTDIPVQQKHWANVTIPLPAKKIPAEATAVRFWIKSDNPRSGLGLTLTLRQQWNWLANRRERKSWLDFADGSWRQMECRLEDFVPYNNDLSPKTARKFSEHTSMSFQLAGWYKKTAGETLTFYLDQVEIVIDSAPPPIPIVLALAGSTDCRQRILADKYVGWGEVLPELFRSSLTVCNLSIAGYSSKWFLERGLWDKLLELRPDYIFLALGNADGLPGDRQTIPDSTYRNNLRLFAEQAQQAGAKLYFIAPLPLSAKDIRNGRAKLHQSETPTISCDDYIQVMRAVASEYALPFLAIPTNKISDLPAHELAQPRAQAIVEALHTLNSPLCEYLKFSHNEEQQ